MSISGMAIPNTDKVCSEHFSILYYRIKEAIGDKGVLNYLSLTERGAMSFCDNSLSGELIPLRSLSKLITSLCYGIAASENKDLCEDAYIWPIIRKFVPIIHKDSVPYYKRLRIKHLLTQSVSFKNPAFLYSENIHDGDSALNVLFREPILRDNGISFCYSNGSAYLLSIVMQCVLGENLSSFAAKHLFCPMGINLYQWKNLDIYCAGATGLFLRAKDVQKIGGLLVHQGRYSGLQLVPINYIEKMATVQLILGDDMYEHEPLHPTAYGYFLWLDNDRNFYVSGKNSHFIYFQPSQDRMIIVLSQQTQSMSIQAALKSFMKQCVLI